MTTSPPAGPSATGRAWSSTGWGVALAVLVDLLIVVVFAVAGRGSHEHGTAAGQVLSTAWPFLAGAGIGWLLARAWQRPLTVRTGVIVWVVTWVVGMGLRAVTGGGTAVPFLLVAAGFLVLLVAWRAGVGLVGRRRG